MAPQIIDLGLWNPYVPDKLPPWTSAAAPGQQFIFVRRDSDGVDWYDFRAKKGSFKDKFLLATTSKETNTGHEIVQGVHRDRNTIAVPIGMRVIQIEDVSPADPTPWKTYEQRIYDPAARTIGDLWAPPVMSVRDYQFAGQAAAEGIISDEDALNWITVGTTPQKLIDTVKEKVTDPERQKRVLLFMAGTTVFPRFHELTPILAASFGKATPEKVDAFFLAASQR
ncbi:hypothetical protein [Methylobacterium sp. CM6257]